MSALMVDASRILDTETLGDHVDRLYRAAWALCGNRADAEDGGASHTEGRGDSPLCLTATDRREGGDWLPRHRFLPSGDVWPVETARPPAARKAK